MGSIQQLSMELLSYLSGAKFLHVPYRGGAPALNDTIGGHVPISVLSVFQVLPLIQEGKLKALAVTDVKRTAVLPNVQTVAEAGVANYEASLLFGLIAPPGLPPAVLAKINAEVVAHHQRAGDAEEARRPGRGADRQHAEAAAVIKAEQEKWAQVIKAANIKERVSRLARICACPHRGARNLRHRDRRVKRERLSRVLAPRGGREHWRSAIVLQ